MLREDLGHRPGVRGYYCDVRLFDWIVDWITKLITKAISAGIESKSIHPLKRQWEENTRRERGRSGLDRNGRGPWVTRQRGCVLTAATLSMLFGWIPTFLNIQWRQMLLQEWSPAWWNLCMDLHHKKSRNIQSLAYGGRVTIYPVYNVVSINQVLSWVIGIRRDFG